MPMKQQGRTTYKTLQGKQVDMDLLRQKNELTPAVGNMRVNARGDELGPGGKIVRSREEILRDYYKSAPGMPDEQLSSNNEITEQQVTPKNTKKRVKQTKEEWIEDKDGNFIPKEMS
tara:strand:+ start:4147 stop:4497 length:351 start_codon:yes stop_codon:yes gene_type:complete